jgi:tetratricopeptide (TPR) repeat protein
LVSSSVINLLVAGGLIRPAPEASPDEFEFGHALLHEAAYESLLRHERRTLHLAAGEVLEAEGNQGDELKPVLADHFLRSGQPTRALEHLCGAGEAALRRFAVSEASTHFAQALDLLDARGADRPRLEQVVLGLGRALELQNRFADALRAYEWLEGAAGARQEPALQLTALTARAKVLATPNPSQDPPEAEAALEKALGLARQLQDPATESRVLWNQMILRVYSGGDVRQAIRSGRESLELARRHNLTEQTAFTLNDLGYAYTALDDPTSSLEALGEAEALWRSLENWPMLADCLAASVVGKHMLGQFDSARAASGEALAISRKIGNVWGEANCRLYVSYVHLDSGRPDLALDATAETARLGHQAGHAVAAYVARADRAWIYSCLGKPKESLAMISGLLASSPPMPEHLVLPHALALRGRIHLRAGNLGDARADFKRAGGIMPSEGLRLMSPFVLPLGTAELALAEERAADALVILEGQMTYLQDHHARVFFPEAMLLRGRARWQAGNLEGAYQDLVDAFRSAEEIGLVRLLPSIASQLSRLSAGSGHPEDVEAWETRARSARERIARRIPDESLRISFEAFESA